MEPTRENFVKLEDKLWEATQLNMRMKQKINRLQARLKVAEKIGPADKQKLERQFLAACQRNEILVKKLREAGIK